MGLAHCQKSNIISYRNNYWSNNKNATLPELHLSTARTRKKMSDILSHVFSLAETMWPGTLLPGMVWWPSGWAPVVPGLTLCLYCRAQVWPTCEHLLASASSQRKRASDTFIIIIETAGGGRRLCPFFFHNLLLRRKAFLLKKKFGKRAAMFPRRLFQPHFHFIHEFGFSSDGSLG
jgi:hypothetical protein